MEKLYKALFQNMNFPIWIKDLEGEFTFVNEKFAKLYNRNIEDFIGKRVEDIFPREFWDRFNSHCNDAIESGEIVTREIYNGVEYSSCKVIPLKNKEGKLVAIAGLIEIINDIGKIIEKDYEVKIEKDLTRRIIDTLPGTIFYKDVHGRYIYANKECLEYFNLSCNEELVGKTDYEMCENKEQALSFMEDDKKVIEGKTSVFNKVYLDRKDGKLIYKEVIKVPFLDKKGNIIGVIGRATNVTEKKELQDRLEILSYTDILTGVKNRAAFEEKQQKYSSSEYLPLGVIMGDVNGLKVVNDTFGHSEGDRLLKQISLILQEACENRGEVFRLGGDEFVILIPNCTLEESEKIIRSIYVKCNEKRENLYTLSIGLGASIKYDEEVDIYKILKDAEEKVYRQKLIQNKSVKGSILNSLKAGLEVNSEETKEHNQRVAITAQCIGVLLNLNIAQLDELKLAAELHDIGMIGVNKNIISKPGMLTDEEFEEMKTHTEKGYRIIKASSQLEGIAEIVLYHHERWDGTGYPMRLKGEAIPLYSRIISICDAYDGMTHDKIYKKALTMNEAMKELRRCKGTQFDPELVEIFISALYS
ncbi:MAG: sensor domain-containing diguanylate cyclase/phosphohydrolase [Clostridium sp.]